MSPDGTASWVTFSVFSHGVMNRDSDCRPSMYLCRVYKYLDIIWLSFWLKYEFYLIYASECKTRCGLGGTVTNNGSADTTEMQ